LTDNALTAFGLGPSRPERRWVDATALAFSAVAFAFALLSGAGEAAIVVFVPPVVLVAAVRGTRPGAVAGLAAGGLYVAESLLDGSSSNVALLAGAVALVAIGAGTGAVTRWQVRQAETIARARQETEAAAATFRAVFENAQDAIIIIDDDGRLLDANPALELVLGRARAQIIGRRAEEFLPPFDHRMLDDVRQELRERRALRGNYAFQLPRGEWRWVEYAASANFLPGRHLAVIRDCTESRLNQDALELRAAEQAAIAELGLLALGGMPEVDLMEAVVRRIADTLALEHVAIIEHAAGSDGQPQLRAGAGWRVGDPQVEDGPCGITVVVHSRDSLWGRLEVRSATPRPFSDHDVDFLRSAANTLGMAIASAADDEELHRRSVEITRLAEARQRIVAEALAAEDRARERISEQLHDELLQSLFVIRQDLAEVAGDPGRTDLAVRARDGVHDAIRSLRAAVFDIHPVVLERGGLRSAVGAVAQHHAGLGGFTIDVEIEPEAEAEHARLLLSLVRELLTNVVRHAGAEHAVVRLWRQGDEVRLEVSDDGCGIDPDMQPALGRGHIGLASAAQRVEALSGRFELAPREGGGTTARAAIPLTRAED
jgi:PAS domain S-box-containing protein